MSDYEEEQQYMASYGQMEQLTQQAGDFQRLEKFADDESFDKAFNTVNRFFQKKSKAKEILCSFRNFESIPLRKYKNPISMVMACIATRSFTQPPNIEGLKKAESILAKINADLRSGGGDADEYKKIFSLALDQQTMQLNISRADVLRYCALMQQK